MSPHAGHSNRDGRLTEILLTLITLSLGISMPNAYASLAAPYIFPSQAVAKNVGGTNLSSIEAGQQIMIETNLTNSGPDLEKPLVAVIVVRDNNGTNVQLAWQSMNLHEGEKSEMGISWVVPENAKSGDTYLIRCFAVDSFTIHAQALSNVIETRFSVG